MDARHARGRAAEQAACEYLQKRGLRLLARNVRSRNGEIDLVMQEAGSLVFVEVRYRRSDRFGSAAETVDARKQQHLINAAQLYIQRHDPAGRLATRFDVIALEDETQNTIKWIKNAFGA